MTGRANEIKIRKQAIEDDHNQSNDDDGLDDLARAPAAVVEDSISDYQRDHGGDELRHHLHRKRDSVGADAQSGLNPLLITLDVFLKLPRENFARLGIDALHV